MFKILCLEKARKILLLTITCACFSLPSLFTGTASVVSITKWITSRTTILVTQLFKHPGNTALTDSGIFITFAITVYTTTFFAECTVFTDRTCPFTLPRVSVTSFWTTTTDFVTEVSVKTCHTAFGTWSSDVTRVLETVITAF